MAYSWSTLLDEILDVVSDTWTDVVPVNGGAGLYELNEIMRISWEEPEEFRYAVWEIGSMELGEWGLVNVVYEPVITIYYLATLSTGLASVRTKLEALKSALYARTYTGATLLDVESIDWSVGLGSNAVFLQKNVDFISGSLSARFAAGETAV